MADSNHVDDVQVPLAVYVMTRPEMIRDRLHASTPASTAMIAYSAGYFMHDLFTCLRWYSEWGFPFLMHGLFCTILYTYGLCTGDLHYYGRPLMMQTEMV
jgi:TLC domain